MDDNTRIERLDNLTANQIAAGEVIERPVSVVKELIENAIDAGSCSIKIEIKEGGLTLIRVTDDGEGIDSRDLPLAVERHATSKLKHIEDLDDLRTLGFRGEALASVASVSSMEIVTRKKGEIAGYRLRVAGEDSPSFEKVGCPEGTQITVEHLFYNTPARLKFMKSPGYESGLIHDLVVQLALGYPRIGFHLENQGKTLLDTHEISQPEDLVELFYGKEARQALVTVEAPVSKGRLSGWVTAPPYSRGTRKGYHVFVNGRRILIRDLQWSMERAFEYLLPKGRFPLLILHFSLPGNLLDVNVHPGKLEIRINDPDLPASITRVLKTMLSGGGMAPDAGSLGGVPSASTGRDGAEEYMAPGQEATASGGTGGRSINEGHGQRNTVAGYNTPVRDWERLFDLTSDGERSLDDLIRRDNIQAGYTDEGQIGEKSRNPDLFGEDGVGKIGFGRIGNEEGRFGEHAPVYTAQDDDLPPASPLIDPEGKNRQLPQNAWGVDSHTRSLQAFAGGDKLEDFFFGPRVAFQIVGQLHATFILAEVDAGLLVVDQHVAHERILFEEMLSGTGEKKSAQMLLEPIQCILTAAEEETLIRHILVLSDLGLVFERFGPRQYLLRAEPAGYPMDQAMVQTLLEELEREGTDYNAEQAKETLLVMRACKAAVKANTRLTVLEMQTLLNRLRETRHPMTCPHGRPILYLLPYRRLLQAFGRSS